MVTGKLFGRSLLIYGVKNGVFVPMCGTTTSNITITADVNEATKSPTSVWKSNYYGKLSYTISAEGLCIINDAKFTHKDLLTAQWNRQPLQWAMKSRDNSKEFYSGYVIINSMSVDADQTDMESFTLNGTGDGDLRIENPTKIYLLGAGGVNEVIGDGSNIIGRVETDGLPQFDEQC